MSKGLEALNKIQHDFGQLKGQELVSCYETIFNALKRLEAIDNAEPSEALKCLNCLERLHDCGVFNYEEMEDYNIIKNYILKAQEPKHYIKWEDLEFKDDKEEMKVILNGSIHTLCYYRNIFCEPLCMIDNTDITIWKENKDFFNDLHLERVEE